MRPLVRSPCATAAVVGLAALAGCGPTGSAGVMAGGALPDGTFLATYGYGAGDTGGGHGPFLSLFDDSTGSHVRDLVHLPDGSGIALGGYSRASNGSIWFALARGPRLRSDVANGDPAPGSCGGTVDRIDEHTDKSTVVYRVNRNFTVWSPVPSPDLRLVAYVSQPCTAAFAASLVVRDLRSGLERRTSVSGGSVASPSWSPDGRRLLVTVLFPIPGPGEGRGFVVTAATGSARLPLAAVARAPDHGCVVASAALDAAGIAVLEGCPDTVTGSARLVQLYPDGAHVAWRATTGLCPNGGSIVGDRTGRRLLISGTAQCRARGAPVDVVQAWDGSLGRQLGRYLNPKQFVESAVW